MSTVNKNYFNRVFELIKDLIYTLLNPKKYFFHQMLVGIVFE